MSTDQRVNARLWLQGIVGPALALPWAGPILFTSAFAAE
jgi:hypothetical protein